MYFSRTSLNIDILAGTRAQLVTMLMMVKFLSEVELENHLVLDAIKETEWDVGYISHETLFLVKRGKFQMVSSLLNL
jgi:predicted solute-binding protein